MALLGFAGVGIRALAAAVPKTVVRNYELTDDFPAEEVRAVVDKIGVIERRFAGEGTCASDLCFAAAQKLLSDLEMPPSSLDALVFVSQTPDYRMPATSIILQDRLGLSTGAIAFDISLACSGFINGLAVVFALLRQGGLTRALLLNGETRSRVYSLKDRGTAFLFGDGGTAALVEASGRFGASYFSLNSDGSRHSLIKMDAGGYRTLSSEETRRERVVDGYGNIRSDEHGYMKGQDVFNFVLEEIPKDIRRVLEFSGRSLEGLDFVVFHQANRFINGYLAKKLKLPPAKVPSCIAKYGNTSSVSIPLTIVSELSGRLESAPEVLMSGFGAGMSWASAVLSLADCHLASMVEV
jgi:3-oxoacyl-[acyl-carrier-protein] synthase-3